MCIMSNTTVADAESGGNGGACRPASLADADALDAFVTDANAALVEFYTTAVASVTG